MPDSLTANTEAYEAKVSITANGTVVACASTNVSPAENDGANPLPDLLRKMADHMQTRAPWVPEGAPSPLHVHHTPYITISGHHLSPEDVQTIQVALSSMDILNTSYLEANGVSREVAAQFPERARELLEMMRPTLASPR